ncbi:hypothetical protein Smp_182780 [Schistosoma mansoni]|uniref:Uncharacterized protein n=1 Tax=Schistosoma mansoni TaxID=6183 RepID=C4QQN2_SCHMA|nr:hypothetical protein Smp_182780 [Schistosoma mansoni]|eukprot:XP_018644519.1 hypothetical protein Smp_182780 [Schistosoma mansoni]
MKVMIIYEYMYTYILHRSNSVLPFYVSTFHLHLLSGYKQCEVRNNINVNSLILLN